MEGFHASKGLAARLNHLQTLATSEDLLLGKPDSGTTGRVRVRHGDHASNVDLDFFR